MMKIFVLILIYSKLSAAERLKYESTSPIEDNVSRRYDLSLWQMLKTAIGRQQVYSDDDEEPVPTQDRQPLNYPFKGSFRNSFVINALTKKMETNNLICSPISALLPLGKLAFGAAGRSYRQLIRALGVDDMDELKWTLNAMIYNLQTLPGVHLNLASLVFVPDTMEINEQLLNVSPETLYYPIHSINLENPSNAAEEINTFVFRQTRGMIEHVVDPSQISGNMSLMVVSAVHFKGMWLKPFRKVEPGKFHTPDETKIVPMMTRQDAYRYMKSDRLQAEILEIPYEGEKSSFIVILPFEEQSLPQVLEAIKKSPELVISIIRNISMQDLERVILTLPKFKIESVLDLKSLYHSIGVRSILDKSTSGLSGIAKNQVLTVSQAIQKSIIEVYELGTNAASVTVVEVIPLALHLNQVIFQVDRPFIFIVQGEQEQLFAGTCVDPVIDK